MNYVPRFPRAMQRTKTPTFRPTVWPAEPPRTPKVTQYRLTPNAETGGLEIYDVIGEVELLPDFVLQEALALEVRSPDDVIALAGQWGLPTGPGEASFRYFAGEAPADVVREMQAWGPAGRRMVHPGAVDLHLRLVRALSRHLLAYLDGASDAPLLAAWSHDGLPVPKSAPQAWLWWEGYLNRGLEAFTVHVRTRPDNEALLTRPAPNLFNACCLQLAQYLAGDTDVSRCANERCGKPFTRQRGRARDEYGQHRSRGVRYCSHLCAKAQSERDRRRRRATGK